MRSHRAQSPVHQDSIDMINDASIGHRASLENDVRIPPPSACHMAHPQLYVLSTFLLLLVANDSPNYFTPSTYRYSFSSLKKSMTFYMLQFYSFHLKLSHAWSGCCINLQIEQLQMRLHQEKSVRIMLERAMGRASSTLSPGHRHFAAQVCMALIMKRNSTC